MLPEHDLGALVGLPGLLRVALEFTLGHGRQVGRAVPVDDRGWRLGLFQVLAGPFDPVELGAHPGHESEMAACRLAPQHHALAVDAELAACPRNQRTAALTSSSMPANPASRASR